MDKSRGEINGKITASRKWRFWRALRKALINFYVYLTLFKLFDSNSCHLNILLYQLYIFASDHDLYKFIDTPTIKMKKKILLLASPIERKG